MRTTDDPVLARVLDVIRANALEIVPDADPQAVVPHSSLADIGANSIDRADIVAMTMEQLGIVVPVAEFAQVRDIGTLAELLRRHLP
ncbi:MAG TPA: phosphopantetheine-binding protein [Micromonosporaceae bacterium]